MTHLALRGSSERVRVTPFPALPAPFKPKSSGYRWPDEKF